MSRCGCAGSCDCILRAGQGITVSGTGSIDQPFNIGARSSRDAGNCLRMGSDGGLFAPCSEDEAADICGISVANLPESGVVFGRGGAGRLLAPDHTIDSMRRSVDLGIDGIHVHVRELGDGTPICFPNESPTNQTGIENLDIKQLTVGYFKNMPIRSGWSDTDNTVNLGGRHGFFGFGERDRVGGSTVADVLSVVGRRAIILFQLIEPFYSPELPAKVLSLIFRYCAQESVIVAASDIDVLDQFIDAGIQTAAVVADEEAANLLPPATLVDRGVEWVMGRLDLVTDGQWLGYSTAGIQVMPYMVNRHYKWAQLDAIGARGCISDDALYMTADPDRYRSVTWSHPLVEPQVFPGTLGYWTDQHPELSTGPGFPGEVYWPGQGRGFYYPRDHPTAAKAFYLPGRMATAPPEPSGVAYRTPSGVFDVLLGWLCPLPDPTSYTIEFELSFRDTPASNRSTGIMFGLPDDRSFDQRDDGRYWVAGVSWTGQVFVERWDGGSLIVDDRAPGTQLVEDAFYRVRLTVTPTQVRFARLSAGGAVQNEAVYTDGTLRGPYLSLYKKETATDNATWTPFAVAYRNLVVQGPWT